MGSVLGGLGAVGSAIGGVGSIAGGVSNLFGGGGSKNTSQRTVGPATPEEIERQRMIDAQISQMMQNQGAQSGQFQQGAQQLNNMFRKQLMQFVTQGVETDPEALAEATSFVDQTFTQPAQVAFEQSFGDLRAQLGEQAAQLGRQVDDETFQSIQARELARAQAGINADRGSRIAQRADELSFGRPMQQLGVLGQGAGFMNDLQQRAMQNRIQLLNSASGQQNRAANLRLGAPTDVLSTPGAGLGARIAGAGSAIGSGLGTIGSISDIFGSNSGGSNEFVGAPSGQYTLGNYQF